MASAKPIARRKEMGNRGRVPAGFRRGRGSLAQGLPERAACSAELAWHFDTLPLAFCLSP